MKKYDPSRSFLAIVALNVTLLAALAGCGDSAEDCAEGGACGSTTAGDGGGGGGGGGQGGGAPDDTPPTVISTTPEDGASAVSTRMLIGATLSEPIDPSSCSGDAFTLMSSNGTTIGGTVDCDGTTATFAPTDDLALLDDYTATLWPAITDLAGNPLADAPVSWSFATRDGAWGDPEIAHVYDTNSVSYRTMAADSDGNATVIWYQSNGVGGNDVWSIRHTAGSGWGAAEVIKANDNQSTWSFPKLAMDDDGNAIVVWTQYDSSYNLWSNRYTAGSGWGTAELIEMSDNEAMDPQLVMDASGNAIAMWSEYNGSTTDVWSNRYTAGSGWGAAEVVGGGSPSQLQLVGDPSGNAIAVWRDYNGTNSSIVSIRYTADTGWGTVDLIKTQSGSTSPLGLTGNEAGAAVAVWNTSGSELWATVYDLVTGWGAAELIETGSGNLGRVVAAMNGDGDATVAWGQFNGSSTDEWANRYTAGSGWGIAELIGTNDLGSPQGSTQMVMGPDGETLVVWPQYNGTFRDLWFNRYAVGPGWGTAELIETQNAGEAQVWQLAMDQRGNVLCVWGQDNGTGGGVVYDLWSRRHVAGSGWGTAELIESAPEHVFFVSPPVAIDARGNALAVWDQASKLWSNTFAEPEG